MLMKVPTANDLALPLPPVIMKKRVSLVNNGLYFGFSVIKAYNIFN